MLYNIFLSCHLSLVIPEIGFEVHATSPVILVFGIYILVLVIYWLVPYTTSDSGGWAAYEVFVSEILVTSKFGLMIFATLPFIFRMFV